MQSKDTVTFGSRKPFAYVVTAETIYSREKNNTMEVNGAPDLFSKYLNLCSAEKRS